MDGDGQHSVECLKKLYEKFLKVEADLVVGSRSRDGQASGARAIGNSIYNKFASWMVNAKVDDLTSGQRIFKTSKIKKNIMDVAKYLFIPNDKYNGIFTG